MISEFSLTTLTIFTKSLITTTKKKPESYPNYQRNLNRLDLKSRRKFPKRKQLLKLKKNFQLTENVEELSDTKFGESFETDSAKEFDTNAEQSQLSSPVPILDFDELDFLEISFPEKQSVNSVEPANEIKTPEVENHFVAESAEDEPDNETEVAEQLSGINLSPADIDAIAERSSKNSPLE